MQGTRIVAAGSNVGDTAGLDDIIDLVAGRHPKCHSCLPIDIGDGEVAHADDVYSDDRTETMRKRRKLGDKHSSNADCVRQAEVDEIGRTQNAGVKKWVGRGVGGAAGSKVGMT